ncbi:MAG: PD-(D/E)XK nuclease family protein, partial [Ghiorsea sp.]
MKKGDYEDFFSKLKDFKVLQNKQKQRGLNNYNLLTAVLRPSDEVRLHSRMIYSLLNPNGKHFQGTLFLEKFLEVISPEKFKLNLDSCAVYKEYKNIDLYITDGTKHIIIENKVHAGDQDRQIERYLELIKNENNAPDAPDVADVLVLYLSLDRKNPSKESLGGMSIKDDKVVSGAGSEIAFYKSIDYKIEIMKWLESCQHEVQNITNLNQAITAYQDVVKMINKEYKGKAMSIADYIKDNKDVYAMALEVSKAMPEVRKSIVDSFFANVVSQLEEKLGNDWEVDLIKDDLAKSYGFPLRVYKKDWHGSNSLLMFGFEFDSKDFHNCYLGVVRLNDKITIKGDIDKKFKSEINELSKKLKTTAWWLHWEWFYNKGDFVEYINNEPQAEAKLVDTFIGLIDVFERQS